MNQHAVLEIEKPIEVMRLADGLGYGEGGISHETRELEARRETLQKVEATITDPEKILVDVGTDSEGNMLDDDGCGDGRGIAKIFKGLKEIPSTLNRHRAKVFGGGVAMASSMLIGLGLAKYKGENNLKNVFHGGVSLLQADGIGFGAHTDAHAHGPSCGCGALDKAPRVLQNVVTLRDEITGSIGALGIDQTGLDEVLGEYTDFAATMDTSDYSGNEVKDNVRDQGKVTKELDGEHLEAYIVLNLVRGKTVNQDIVREVSDQKVQTFAVDVWRMQDIAARAFPDDEKLQHKAFLSQLVYTLGVGATLTKGDLPVYVIRQQAA